MLFRIQGLSFEILYRGDHFDEEAYRDIFRKLQEENYFDSALNIDALVTTEKKEGTEIDNSLGIRFRRPTSAQLSRADEIPSWLKRAHENEGFIPYR